MATTYAIPNGRTVMDATTFTSTGTTQVISNADNGTTGFQPDFVWTKIRNNTGSHFLNDSVRGVANVLFSNTTAATSSLPTFMTSFNSNGFTMGTGNYANANSIVGWQWQAGQGTTSSNTSGTITSTVSVNTTAGFSIVTYTGTGSAATVGHGLGVTPSMIIVKSRNTAGTDWPVYHASLGATGIVALDSTSGFITISTPWSNTAPTSSVMTVGTSGDTNGSGRTYVAYCWAPVAGFSQFGSYTGNGSTDGPFVYTGFRPNYLLVKNVTSGSANDWAVFCSAMSPYNVEINGLKPNSAEAEYSGYNYRDFLSNGFKLRNGDGDVNASGRTYIYAAFAENPFKYANAR